MKSIRIPAQPSDSLNWESEIHEAARAADSGDRLFWEFDLGLNVPYFPLEDELRFQTLSLALAAFTKEVWPRFEKQTAGALLYRGSADFSSFFSWTEKQQENWSRWKEGRPDAEEGHLRRLFCAESFAAYFQMLAHKLPDELPLTLHLNALGIGSLARSYHLLAPERFEHFVLRIDGMPEEIYREGLKNREFGEGGSSDFLAGTSGIAKGKTRSEDEKCETKPAPAKADYSITSGIKEAQFGICFPSDVFCSGAILDRIDRYLAALKTPYRVVFESLLSEQWEGLDSLTVWPDGLSVQGKRKLMGFRAAGGTVLDEKNEEFL